MLIKNLGSTCEQWGHYTLPPGEWSYLPTQTAIQAQLDKKANFQCLKGALENNDLPDVVIFSGCSIGTTGGGQQPAQIAKTLRQQGHRVLYVQTSQGHYDDDRLIILQDGKLFQALAPSHQGIQAWNETLSEFSNHPERIALFTFPSHYLLELAQVAWMNGYKTVYWCLDDWAEINRIQSQNAYHEDVEREMVTFCDRTLATANILARKLQPWTEKTVEIIPNAFSRENFPHFREAPTQPEDLHTGEKTLIYWGELQGRWIDTDLIEGLARLEPTWAINLIGPHQRAERKINLPNVHYLGEKPVSELYRYGYHSDCGLIPFKQGKVSDAVNPIKAYEYLAANLPIVSSPMPELDAFPLTFQVPGVPACFQEAIRTLPDKQGFEATRAFLENSTWQKRATAFLNASTGVKHAALAH
jgi:hypothetical protein